jgi:Protein of unknown function (DUF3727)
MCDLLPARLMDVSNLLDSMPLLGDDNSELDCHVVADVELGDERFVLLTPKKTWVSVVRDDEDGVVEVETDDYAPLAAAFDEALADKNLKVTVVSGEYLLEGTLSEELQEVCDSISISDDEDDETYLILADIEKEDGQYLVLAPDMPAMFAARVKDGKAVALSEKELERVESHLEKALEARVN